MPIHANSVIATQINTFDAILYTSLTDRENYCYITANVNITAGQEVAIYAPQFQALSDAIVAYTSINRNGLVSDLFSNAVGYKMMNAMHGTSYTQAPNLISSNLFNMNGQITAIKASTINAYADYNGSFTLLPATTTLISNADTVESSYITGTLQPAMISVVKSIVNRLIVEDILAVGSITKQQVGHWWYGSSVGELGYKLMNLKYNFGLTPPPYIP